MGLGLHVFGHLPEIPRRGLLKVSLLSLAAPEFADKFHIQKGLNVSVPIMVWVNRLKQGLVESPVGFGNVHQCSDEGLVGTDDELIRSC